MKRILTSLLLLLAGAGALKSADMTDGHKLTTLWKQYEDASKADLPQTEASILEKIKAEALEKRLPVDFWDAATKYVNTVQRRDWKQSSALRSALAAEYSSIW